jgi:hypothetical protein
MAVQVEPVVEGLKLFKDRQFMKVEGLITLTFVGMVNVVSDGIDKGLRADHRDGG